MKSHKSNPGRKARDELLQHMESTAASSSRLLTDFFELASIPIKKELDFSSESLDRLELQYFRFLEAGNADSVLSLDELERLMSYYLGEVIVRNAGGEWAIYEGRYHVLSPKVVRIVSTGLHHDVFLFCAQFKDKTHLLGAKHHRALRTFFRSVAKSGFE